MSPAELLSSAPSFTGGAAGPSRADAGQQSEFGVWFANPFSVGPGAQSSASVPSQWEAVQTAPARAVSQLTPILVVGLVVLAVVIVARR